MRDRIKAALTQAIKDRDQIRVSTLRLISAAIKDRDIGARGEGNDTGVSQGEILSILDKMISQRNESIKAYEEGGRLELAERERSEIGVIREFLPRQLTEEEISRAIQMAIDEVGASGIRDMGRVMGQLKGRYAGQMDFGKVGPAVRNLLG
ncbi:MAG: GatB/YqeY domain-containing protein [Rhodobacteraceae bacterium]|nr:GatB/YqeY domain-containing protein [Paracoccaceae bacterium]MCY4140135.1 GatB/YqeY domain-containing protein [Paracoccaceae bacterium]